MMRQPCSHLSPDSGALNAITCDLSRKEIHFPERIHYESLCCTKNGIEKLRGKKVPRLICLAGKKMSKQRWNWITQASRPLTASSTRALRGKK